MKAAPGKLWRCTALAGAAALLAGFAGSAQADDHGWKHRWRHGHHHHHHGVPQFGVAPFFTPYVAPPPVVYPPPRTVYVPPLVTYPEQTYVPYAAPGMSFNFTVPLR